MRRPTPEVVVMVFTPGVSTKETVPALAVTAGGIPRAAGGGMPKGMVVLGGGMLALTLGGNCASGAPWGVALVKGLEVLTVFTKDGAEYELVGPKGLARLDGGAPPSLRIDVWFMVSWLVPPETAIDWGTGCCWTRGFGTPWGSCRGAG